MKTAKARQLKVFEIQCPECGEGIGNPSNGSLIWIPGEDKLYPEVITCDTCYADVLLPPKVRLANWN